MVKNQSAFTTAIDEMENIPRNEETQIDENIFKQMIEYNFSISYELNCFYNIFCFWS